MDSRFETPGLLSGSKRLGQVVDLGGLLRDHHFGHHERAGEPGVEPLRDVARQFQVLALILAHRNQIGVVEQYVGGLQHRIGEQTDRRGFGPLLEGLVLELRHPRRLSETGETAEDPG